MNTKKKYLGIIFCILCISICMIACSKKTEEDEQTGQEDPQKVFTEEVLSGVVKVTRPMKRQSVDDEESIRNICSLLSQLVLTPKISEEQLYGHEIYELVYADGTILSIGVSSNEIVVDDGCYQPDKNICGGLRKEFEK